MSLNQDELEASIVNKRARIDDAEVANAIMQIQIGGTANKKPVQDFSSYFWQNFFLIILK